jgi:pimeloyl-ACP methyl ester carboxylesterase
MQIVERGGGEPIVIIPGLQGRWDYMRPLVDALATSWRVITFDLCDEPSADAPYDSTRPLDSMTAQVEAVLDRLGLKRAVICGVSFGGIVALRFAARHPGRTAALVLVSTPGPRWHLRRRHEIYARWPRLFGLVFLAETPLRLRAEVAAALPDLRSRRRFIGFQLRTLLGAPVSVRRMAARARLIGEGDRRGECAAVTSATLIVHGEPALDHVVNVDGTSEYAGLIRNAQCAVVERTGHLGSITKPDEVAAIFLQFTRGVREKDGHGSAA